MGNWRGWVGLVAIVLGGCPAAAVGAGGAGGSAGAAGVAGAAGAAGTAGVAGSAGAAGVGGAGYGGVGGFGGAGYGGVGGFGGVSGGDGGLISPDGGTCVPGMRCGPEGPDSNDCGTLTLNAEVEETVTPGNLLVIFDRSGSMEEPWGTLGPKWVVAKDALANALTPVADRLTVGAVMFPTVGCIVVAGSVAPITDPSQINFTPGPQFIQRWNTYWMNNTLQPGTPVALAFDAAAASLAGATLTGTTAVVLFTDGEPTDVGLCPAFQMASADRAAQFLAMGIKTYVVGLPGASGVQVLRDIAIAGGTGDYITPDDPAVLSQRIASIATSTISVGFDSCSITINPPAEAPDDLQLVVTENGMELGVDRDLGTGGGWSITPDGAQVEITGQLCEEMKSGRFSSIKFKFGCVNLPPLPPPMPPD